MATIIMYEVKDGKPLAMYSQTLTTTMPESDCKNEVFIHMRTDDGKSQLIAIPKRNWREFVRKCRKLSRNTSA